MLNGNIEQSEYVLQGHIIVIVGFTGTQNSHIMLYKDTEQSELYLHGQRTLKACFTRTHYSQIMLYRDTEQSEQTVEKLFLRIWKGPSEPRLVR